jgi:2-phosphosulfolactate phosphatase
MGEEVFQQVKHKVRFEWGAAGVKNLAPLSNVVVIVDVLSFTTCVDVATSRGAMVYPYRFKDESAKSYAESVGAILAGKRGEGVSLSPSSLVGLNPGGKVCLPSPNGATCTMVAKNSATTVIAASLRNAEAVASYILNHHPSGVISVIACGEHWPGGEPRPSIEDLVGAGAVLHYFDQQLLSPEAQIAALAFRSIKPKINESLLECSSGQELINKGYLEDIYFAAELNASSTVPILKMGAFQAHFSL